MNVAAFKRLLKPLGYRDFLLLWIGQSISSLGSSFQTVALVWMVLQFHGSPLDLTAAMLALAIPQALLTLVGGVITDRLDARTVMLWCDFVRILTSGLIALMAMTGVLLLWLLCVILALHGVANGIFNPASGSIAPRLVAKEDLDSANSLSSLMSQLGSILGVLPAGLLVAYSGPALAFAVNSLSYVVAVFAALLMRPLVREPHNKNLSPWQDARQGLRYLGTLPWLMTMILMDSLAAIAAIGPSSIGLPLLARNVMHVGAQGYSLLIWSFSCGSILGMLLPSLYSFRRNRGLMCIVLQFVEALLLAAIAIAPLPLASLCIAGWGLLNGVLIILTISLIQVNVANSMLGRVMSFWMLASFGLVPLSQLGTGLITSAIGPQLLFVGAGAVTLLGAVLGICVPALRHLN